MRPAERNRELSMPSSIEYTVASLARAVERSGFSGAQVGVREGAPGHVSLFDDEGNQSFFMFNSGSWYGYSCTEDEVG